MGRSRAVGTIALAASATLAYSCYKPTFDADCTLRCGAGNVCPAGLQCNPEGMCSADGTTCHVGPGGDAGGPGGPDAGSSGSSGCWSYMPTGFDPCTLMTASGVFDPASGTTFDTSGVDCTQVVGDICVLHVTELHVGGGLSVTGTRPLRIVVEGDAIIDGSIGGTSSGAAGSACSGGTGGIGANGIGGGGGAGGGFATFGGVGGDPGGLSTTVSATSLVPSCPGAPGGAGEHGAAGGPGGNPGESLQISVKGSLTLTGSIHMNGAGGRGGQGTPTDFAGGGGGGAGGVVIVEAAKIPQGQLTSVCALGGPGGFGANGTTTGAGGATYSTCAGGLTTSGPGAGGAGDTGTGAGDGLAAGSGVGGGGGGGGCGLILVHDASGSGTSTSTCHL